MYNFDEIVDRRNSNSLKWDIKDDVLPLWVADMDFKVCDDITNAIKKRLEVEAFGYNIIPDSWYDAYINWWKKRHNFTINKEWLMFSTGVVPSISSIVRKMTNKNDKVVLLTPVYNIFFNSIYNNGRYILESKLIYQDGKYTIDFNDLENKLSDNKTKLLILCNPHNPIGRIWSYDELQKIGHLCKKHGVIVLSDEIHCDLVDPNKAYIPFASVDDICKNNSITCVAPTKTFNIAGLQTSAIFVPNPYIKRLVERGINTDEIAEPNTFACVASTAAFNYGEVWLDELRAYIYNNKLALKDFISKNMPKVKLVESEATYLCWLDFSELTKNTNDFVKYLEKTEKLLLCEGSEYGNSGSSFIRINLATSFITFMKALDRLKRGYEAFF